MKRGDSNVGNGSNLNAFINNVPEFSRDVLNDLPLTCETEFPTGAN